MSLGGIALRVFGGIALIAILSLILYPAFSPGTAISKTSACYNQMRQCATGLSMYMSDNDDFLPVSGTWMDASFPYLQTDDHFHCTKSPTGSKYGIAMNSALVGLKVVPDKDVPLTFDSTLLSRNATASVNTMPNPGRHGGYNVVGFMDTHVKALRPQDLGALAKPPKGNAGTNQ